MSCNKYQPHVLVLPEDDANRQLANGFLLDPLVPLRAIQVLEEVGGWAQVRDRFLSDHVYEMGLYPNRNMILLVDFDGREERLTNVKAAIPAQLIERVFILGAWTNPEELRRAVVLSYEEIGLALARDCREETEGTWGHNLLRHNAPELGRLRPRLCPVLFPHA